MQKFEIGSTVQYNSKEGSDSIYEDGEICIVTSYNPPCNAYKLQGINHEEWTSAWFPEECITLLDKWKQDAFKICGEELSRRGSSQSVLDELVQAGDIKGSNARLIARSIVSPYEDYFDAEIAKKLEPTLQMWDKKSKKVNSSPQTIDELKEKLQEIRVDSENALFKLNKLKQEYPQILHVQEFKVGNTKAVLCTLGSNKIEIDALKEKLQEFRGVNEIDALKEKQVKALCSQPNSNVTTKIVLCAGKHIDKELEKEQKKIRKLENKQRQKALKFKNKKF